MSNTLPLESAWIRVDPGRSGESASEKSASEKSAQFFFSPADF